MPSHRQRHTMNDAEAAAAKKQRQVHNIIQDMVIALLVISAVYMVMAIAADPVILWEGTVTGVLAILLYRTHSRFAALLLIVMSLVAVSNGIVTVIGAVDLGSRNLPLAFVSLWCAWRSRQATLLL